MSRKTNMRAVWFEKFGPAKDTLVFGEIAIPQVAAGEVLIRMKTSAVNPSDVKKRAGSAPNLLNDGPVIP
ncbi:MAG: NADPH:quinone reductase, partial [Gammaproteobacteria bacterium]|nr:NADPH:quinone reductase [Gammaproteobacteria bacterium]